jgi:outer membrane protein assembly factor BamB
MAQLKAGSTVGGETILVEGGLGNIDPDLVGSVLLKHSIDNPRVYVYDTLDEDKFGRSVDISGEYVISGAYSDDISGSTQSGTAYIYNAVSGNLLHTLNNPNAYSTPTSDYFGHSVSISGNYAIVGAPYEDDAGGIYSGKAYIFNVTTGNLVHTLDNPNPYGSSDSDYFGYSVSISGNYAIVGAYREDDAGGTSSGKAYIFNVSTGALVHTLDNPTAYFTSGGDEFAKSVSISGNYAIVGAYREDDAGGGNSGKAYIFNVTTGNLVHTLDNPNPYGSSLGDWFGNSVAISGNYAIVGAQYEDDASGTSSGKAYIFNVTTGNLVHTLNNPNAYSTSASDSFGYSVSISGNYAIVGAWGEDDAGGSKSGKAYIFDVSTGALVDKLDNPNAYGSSVDDLFGIAVAISGKYIAIGASGEEVTAGAQDQGQLYTYEIY